MNSKTLDALASGTVDIIKKTIAPRDAQISSLQQLVSELREKVAALESKPSLNFAGTHSDTGRYTPGDAVVRQGGLWICLAATTGPFDHRYWPLAVKKGDAR